MTDFRTVARALQPYISDTYDLLNAADAVLTAMSTPAMPDKPTHEDLVAIALDSESVMNFIRDEQKINAIKELRSLTRCSLKETKDAVEDYRVVHKGVLLRNGNW